MGASKQEKFSIAADGQAFFAKMAGLRGDAKASEAHWNLALNYQRDSISNRECGE